jgi:serine/threonine protein kinase/WD40 repeat protein
MSHSDSDADPLVDLAQEFADRYRRGERPSLSEYAGRYPEHAERIRRIFPAMVAMEQLGSSGEWSGGTLADRPGSGPALERLGEYRILREIARGGMGVVYEAVQESLGRHVALKVLPLHRMVRESQLERFRREARAAARLHHSNIVPVFGVGESGGVHYYAMQYIQGQNLEDVLQEVRRLRGRPVESPVVGTRRSGLSASLAQSLLSGRPGAARGDAGVRATGFAPLAADAPSPTLVEPGSSASESDLAGQSELQYARSVARIGLQVAEALAYAHQQGVLHRDIKPANILLDTQGTAWVTDFGLAKADDSAELTEQGDIVGTLRYMAPERFGGRADHRSDIYGLGLTLYEMLTLRSAFVSSDRARLVQRVLHVEPPRPRKLDRSLPRDLETIVLKAMAKEPGRRYATAAALAEDLRRFLADRPILARRAPAWERTWRFCRRNPALAISGGLVVTLLAAIAIGSAAWTARLDAELRRTGEARRSEQAAKKDALDKLWRSYLARAQAGRFGRRPGRRLDGLDALREAIPVARSVGAPRSSFDELRDEAIACLALPDLRPGKAAIDLPAAAGGPVFDAWFRRYALTAPGGEVLVHRVGQREPIARVIGPGAPLGRLWISPDGRSLAIAGADALQVRDIDAGRVVLHRAGKAVSLEFDSDSHRAAIGLADGTVVLADVTDGRELTRFQAGFTPAPLALRADGTRLAIADEFRDTGVQIWDLEPPRKAAVLRLAERGPAVALAWSPDGHRLGVGLANSSAAEIWDIAARRPSVVLEGHAQRVGLLSFHPDGRLILTISWDGSSRLWDVATGRSVVHWQSQIIDPHFARDGKACGVVAIGGEKRLLEVEPGREYRTLNVDLGVGRGDFYRADIGPDDWLAVGMADGVRLWDLDTGGEMAFLPIGWVTSASFLSGKEGRELLSCGPTGLYRWPIVEEPESPGRMRIGAPRAVRLPISPSVASVTPDGRAALVSDEGAGKAIVLDLETESVRCTLAPHPAVSEGFLSPDGRWAATSGWHTSTVKIWDARTGSLARDLPLGPQNAAFFSPDGRTLVTSLFDRYGFREVPSWRAVRDLNWEIPSYPGWVAFSPDGRLVALERAPGVVHLLDAETGRTLARLDDPDSDRARWLGFTADGGRLVAIAPYSRAIHVWDLREISRQLAGVGLRDEPLSSLWAEEPAPRPRRSAGVVVEASASAGLALERKSRAEIGWARRAIAAKPGSALERNTLAWSYLTAPEPVSDPARALELAQEAVRLEPGNPMYRNTLGVAYYRAGRYREAIDLLQADLEGQEDRFLPWDLCFLAMSYHRLGEKDRARDYRAWALRWSRDQKGLSVEHVHEFTAIREEMEATLAR